MKNKALVSIFTISAFLLSGCDFFETKHVNSGSEINYNNYYDEIKNVKIPENTILKLTVNTDNEIKYIDIVNSKDGKLFTIKDGVITFKNPPDFENPLDSNKDNIYEVEIYMIDKNENEYYILFKVQVLDVDEGGGGDNNHTFTLDTDNDYIPNNIEKFIGKDANNSDENGNGILDGLEGDEFFEKQWYIRSIGIATNPSEVASIEGNDLNLLETYKGYMGLNQIIQIVDSGIDSEHEDLKENFDLNRSLDGDMQGAPTPGGIFKPHGTMLAGIAAARAFNGVGVRGVAPFAKIAGSNWLAKQSLDGLDKAWLSGNGANEITVSNNSWGRYFTADTIYEDIMAESVNKLRDGKGRIFVFASGNARSEHADANTQFVINNRYAIVVGALTYKNEIANYSTPGANVWTVAYGGADTFNKGPTIATTYISGKSSNTWDSDSKKNYTYAMAGSSAAAPMVSGSIALILEACPDLTYRDVKYLIATTAKKVDDDNTSWIQNAAGHNFSRDYGFGLIDTQIAVAKCQTVYKMLPQEESCEDSLEELNKTIEQSSIESLNIDKDLNVEWVEADIDINASNASNIDIYLISPSGTKIQLLKSGTVIDNYHIPYANWMSGGFRFSTGAMLDENSAGTWKIEITNNNNDNIKLNNLNLKIYGHKKES